MISEEEPNYKMTGKYLFFSPDQDRLIEIATNEPNSFSTTNPTDHK